MNSKNTLSITEARQKIFQINQKLKKRERYYTLTQNGKPSMVWMSVDEFDSWRETLEVMQEMPDLKKDIQEAERDYASGDYRRYTTLDEILKKEKLMLVQDKNNKKYVHSKTKTKSRKRTKKTT